MAVVRSNPFSISVVLPSGHDYFDELASRPDHHHSCALRTQAEIDDNLHGRVQSPRDVVYDSALDAARFRIPPGSGSIAQQVRCFFPVVDSGNLLFTWEGRWEAGFVDPGDIEGLRTNKAYQLGREAMGDKRRLEPRTHFSQADPPDVARTDVRVYTYTPAMSPDGDRIGPQVGEFLIAPDVWTRFWIWVDFDGGRFSYWVADETRAPVVIIDDVAMDYSTAPTPGLDNFWFEHNSSQSRDMPGPGPELSIWGRNLVVLSNVVAPPADVVALGATVEA